MKIRKLIPFLIFLIVAVGIYFGATNLKTVKPFLLKKINKNQASLFPNFQEGKVDWIQMGKEKQKKVFRKINSVWREENATQSAKPELFNDILKTVSQLDRRELVSSNPAKKSIFGVDEQALVVILKAKEQTLAQLYIGKRGQDFLSNFYRKEGENNVYLSKEALDQIFMAPLSSQ